MAFCKTSIPFLVKKTHFALVSVLCFKIKTNLLVYTTLTLKLIRNCVDLFVKFPSEWMKVRCHFKLVNII